MAVIAAHRLPSQSTPMNATSITTQIAPAIPDARSVSPEIGVEKPERPSASGRMLLPVIAVGVALAGVFYAGGNWNEWTSNASYQTTNDAAVGADVSFISARVSGNLVSAHVADYQHVRKGDLIAEIDPREYDAAASLASANVSAARSSRANLTNQEALQLAAIVAATAQHDSALASLEQSRLEYERQQNLGQASTEQRLQQSHAAYLQAQATAESTAAAIDQQKAQLDVLRGQESLLDAQIAAQSASLTAAELHREFTRIYAPFDGTVGKQSAHVGDYLSIGGNIVPIVPNEVYVTANFKETQLANMHVGQVAEVKLDSFPGKILRGKVERMSPASGSTFALLPPDNATGNYTKVVQRIPVRITIDYGQPLRDVPSPGLSAIVTVDTRRQRQ